MVISFLSMLHALKVGEVSVVASIVRLGFTTTFLLAAVLVSGRLTTYKGTSRSN